MRNHGYGWNHKRVWRSYKDMGLNLPRRSTKRRLPEGPRIPLVALEAKNVSWALDFMHDTLYSGKPFRSLNVIDEANRRVLSIEIDTSLPAARVVRVLDQLGEVYGLQEALGLDNGSELRSTALTEWYEDRGIELRYIQQASPVRTPSSSDLIEPTDTKSWTPISSPTSKRFERLPKSGLTNITKNSLIRPTGSCQPFRTGNTPNQQKCPLSDCLLDRGDYNCIGFYN
jgi:hypothetical protein